MDEVDNEETIDLTPQIAIAPEYAFTRRVEISYRFLKLLFLDFLSIRSLHLKILKMNFLVNVQVNTL